MDMLPQGQNCVRTKNESPIEIQILKYLLVSFTPIFRYNYKSNYQVAYRYWILRDFSLLNVQYTFKFDITVFPWIQARHPKSV